MARDITKVAVGDVIVYFDPEDGTGEVELGHTKGGANFILNREFADLIVDEYGNTPVNAVFTGQDLMVEVFLAQPTKDVLRFVTPEGRYAISGTDNKLGIGSTAGGLMTDNTGLLRLHPRAKASTDRNDDIYIWKAYSHDNVEMAYKVDEQRIVKVTFRALVDDTQPDGQRLGRIGDAAIS